jgi:hypothetical protein
MSGILNPGACFWWHVAGYFPAWYGDAVDIIFGLHSAESTLVILT